VTQHRWIQIIVAFALLAIIGTGIFFMNPSITEESEIKKLTIMIRVGDTFQNNNNQYLEELGKRLGVQIEVLNVPVNSYNDKLSVIMASGSTPDIVQINWTGEGHFSGWAQSDMIVPIDLEQAPNIVYNVPNTLLSLMKVGKDDKVYGVPGITTSYPYGVIIRKDWLDRLRLETPRTLAEYENVLEAFVSMDPDANNKKDTIGITSWRLNQFGAVFGGAFKTDYYWNTLHPDMGDTQRQIVFREQQKGYLNLLDFARASYERGWLDPDFTYLHNAEHKFILGKVGMVGGYSNQTLQLEKELQQFVPEARLEWILVPADAEGRHWNYTPESYGYHGAGSMIGDQAIFVITKNGDKETALAFLDQMNTREMILFANLGMEGIHYEKYDSNRNIVKRSPAQVNAINRDLFGISDTFRKEGLVQLGDNAAEIERLTYYRDKGKLLITSPLSYSMGFVSEVAQFHLTNPMFREQERNMVLDYVTGDISRADYVSYLDNEHSPQLAALLANIRNRYQQLSDLQQ
jgi:ABC-type glycerol-3-phosphate transport system substrate-binding protein